MDELLSRLVFSRLMRVPIAGYDEADGRDSPAGSRRRLME